MGERKEGRLRGRESKLISSERVKRKKEKIGMVGKLLIKINC